MTGIEEFERRMCVLLKVPQTTLAERIIRLKGDLFCQLPSHEESPVCSPPPTAMAAAKEREWGRESEIEIGGVRWEAEEDEGKEKEEQEEQELERVQFKVTRGLRSNSRIQVR